jgi:hypothetical protein
MAALLSPVLRLDDAQLGLLLLFGCLPPAVLNFMVAEAVPAGAGARSRRSC